MITLSNTLQLSDQLIAFWLKWQQLLQKAHSHQTLDLPGNGNTGT
jgi:hypothetical protein